MQNLNEIYENIAFTKNIKELAQTYEEIAIMRMQKIKDSVIKNREFVNKIKPMFFNLKFTRENLTERHILSKRLEKVSTKKLLVLVSPNDRLVGDITKKLFDLFLEKYEGFVGYEILVLGRTGKRFADAYVKGGKYHFFEIPSKANIDELKKIIDFIKQYDIVNVFYTTFINFLQQEPYSEELKGNLSHLDDPNIKLELMEKYIFEPSIDTMIDYFQEEILVSIFKEKLSEAELAKLGSRVQAMDSATKNSEELLKKLDRELNVIDKSEKNKKQLALVSGISLWKNRI